MVHVIEVDEVESGNHAGMLSIQAPRVLNDRLQEIPGYRHVNISGLVVIPKAWPQILQLGTIAKETGSRIQRDEELSAWIKQAAADWATLRRRAAAVPPKGSPRIEGYYQHQVAGADWLIAPGPMQGRILLDETGAGKTFTVGRALLDLDREALPVLVTCPESVMESGWEAAFGVFAPDLRVVMLTGNITQRRKKIAALADGEYDVAIIGHTNLKAHTRFSAFPGHALRKCIKCGGPKLTSGKVDADGVPIPEYDSKGKLIKELTATQCQAHIKELNEIPWGVIVLDEAHRAMNARSQITQAAWGVARYAPSQPRRWALTGTPISKRTEQIWPLLHFADPAGHPTKSKWIDHYCEKGWDPFKAFEVLGIRPERDAEFHQIFDGVTRRVLKDQCLDLPPKIRGGSLERHVQMTGEQLDVYTQMRDEMLIQVDGGLITAQNALVQARRLSMLASGTGTPDPTSPPGQQRMLLRTPSVKLDALLQDWQDDVWEGQPIVIGFSSLRALNMVSNTLIEKGLVTPNDVAMITGPTPTSVRARHIAEFQDGKRKVAMMTFAAGGTGITLTAAPYFLWFERDWSPILNAQAEDRVHRIGSERHKTITYIDYVVTNSNERRQMRQIGKDAQTLENLVHDKDRLRELFV